MASEKTQVCKKNNKIPTPISSRNPSPRPNPNTGFVIKTPKTSKFQVARVKGQVTWKYRYKVSGDDEDGSDDDEDAELLLKRLVTKDGKQSVSAELTLAEIAHGPSSDEFTFLRFDLKPDNNPNDNEFWETCGEGKVMSGLNYKLDLQVSFQPRNC